MGKKVKRLNGNRIMPALLAALLLFFGMSITISATELLEEDSVEYQNVYGASAEMKESVDKSGVAEQVIEGARGTLEALISPLIYGIATALNMAMENGQVDLSLDAVVYGRVASTRQMVIDLAHFGLEQNNPYGIMGASLYLILKRVSYAIVPVVVMILLLVNLFRNNRKGREKLKDLFNNVVVYFLTIEAMPYIVELYIYVRDFFMYIVKKGMIDVIGAIKGVRRYGSISDGLYELMEDMYSDSLSIIIALMLLGVVFAGIFYLWDYVKIALLLMATFGLFPIIVLIMFFKPKIISDWFDILIPSLTIPFLDAILLMAPSVIFAVVSEVLNIGGLASGGGKRVGLGVCLILLCSIFVAKGIRDIILRKLFNFDGNIRGGGGAVMAIMAAARMMMPQNNKGGSSTGGYAASNSRESESRAVEQRERGSLMRDADSRIADGVPESSYGSSSKHGETPSGTDAFVESKNVAPEEALEEMLGKDVVEGGVESLEHSELEEVSAGATEPGITALGREPATDMSSLEGSVNEESIEGDGSMPSERITADIPGTTDCDVVNHAYDDIRASEDFGNLSARDRARFENLARMDDMESRIEANNRVIEDAGYDKENIRQQYRQDYRREQNSNAELLKKEEELKQSRDMITDISSAEYQTANHAYMEAVKNREDSDSRMGNLQRAYDAAQQNVGYSRNLDHYRQMENSYAHNSGLGGMDNRTYRNATEFYDRKRVEQIVKRQADYRNFDSGRFDGVLSPQDRENFYRERASQQRREEIADRARKIGGVVGGTLGAAAAVYGGASAMGVGMMVGSAAVGGVSGRTAGAVSGSSEPRREQRANNVVNENRGNTETVYLESETSNNAQRSYMRNTHNAPPQQNGMEAIKDYRSRGEQRVEDIRNS